MVALFTPLWQGWESSEMPSTSTSQVLPCPSAPGKGQVQAHSQLLALASALYHQLPKRGTY